MKSVQQEGQIDKDGRLFVRWVELTDCLCVEIEDPFHQTWLKPDQALNLLAWLKAHQGELEHMVKPKKRRH